MPVSHLALTVSHIPTATSFYLSALQPLGYRYIGQRGDAIGLGVNDADFFLCQERTGARVTPTHIAFAADNRLIVRDCYTAALNAGGRPSGPPGYRNDDCSCFNSAVEDPDGNTIEFIYREPCNSSGHDRASVPSEHHSTRSPQSTVAREEVRNDADYFGSFAAKAQTTAQTALDLASSASKSLKKSSAPTPGISRSKTDPVTSTSSPGGNVIVGTLLGAAAGAAVAYAVAKSERNSSADEAKFAASVRSRDTRSRNDEVKPPASKKSDRARNSTTAIPSRPARPAIEAPPYDDTGLEDTISRYTSSTRPKYPRSKTFEEIEYKPRSSSSGRSGRFSMKRASTMPLQHGEEDAYEDNVNVWSSPPPTSQYSTRRRRSLYDDSNLQRHDSGVSTRSSRRSSPSKTSTVKPPPSARDSPSQSAANVALPPSQATSYVSGGKQSSRASKGHSYVSAAHVPLPPSRATSYVSAAQVPVPSSEFVGGYAELAEESDGLGDMESVTPDDSISCIDFSKPKKKSSKNGSRKSSHYSSKRSEADSESTIRPSRPKGSKHSVKTLPERTKDEYYGSKSGRRSAATYA